MDIEKALLDPDGVFDTPEDVLNHPELSREDKIKILERWEYDAKQLCVADDENMADGNGNDILSRILDALIQLQSEDI